MQVYTPPARAPLPDDFDEFYESLTPQEKELHLLAIEMLQSSYFVQWCHMYRNWKKAKAKAVAVAIGVGVGIAGDKK
jgi:hypothetical protein